MKKKKNAEHHAVHAEELLVREQPRTAHKETDRHQAKERHHAAEGNEKVPEHKKMRLPDS